MFRSPLADGVIILVIVLLFAGPKRLPMLSRSIGESIKEFKGGITTSEKQELDGSKSEPPADSSTGRDSASELSLRTDLWTEDRSSRAWLQQR